MSPRLYRDASGRFDVTLPDRWVAEPDGEEGVLLYRDEGFGLLHLMPFARGADEELDPAEELYAFLVEQDIELEEDEVEDLGLEETGALAFCEYLAEEADEVVYWLMAVAVTHGLLLFGSYSCPSEYRGMEREPVVETLKSIRFRVPS